MTPRERCHAGQQFFRYDDPLAANVINNPAEIDRVPQDYCIHNKVEARCPVSHSLGRKNEHSVIADPNGTKTQSRDNFAGTLLTSFLALGVKRKNCRVNIQLLRYNSDNRLCGNLSSTQCTTEVTDKCELNSKTKAVMRPTMLSGECNILAGQSKPGKRLLIKLR